MDGWQKLEVISKAVAAVLIPIAVVYLGNQVAIANTQRETEAKFVELATAILTENPGTNQSVESERIRQWAVDVINKYSGVPMPAATAKALVQNTALPTVVATAPAQLSADPAGTWGVVFGGDTSLESAQHEVTKTAESMGIGAGEIFRRAGSYRSVKVYVSRAEAEDGLGKARAVRPSTYVVNMATWCPTSTKKSGYYECELSNR